MSARDKISIPGLPVSCRVGVPDRERAVPQQVLIELDLFLDLSAAGREDDVNRTVDYSAVSTTVVATARARPRKLLESLAEDIAAAVLEAYDIAAIRVRVKKPGALRARGVPFAAVEIERSKRADG